MNGFEERLNELFELGFTPIPLKPKGKAPAVSHWKEFQNREPTEAESEYWINHCANNANVGVITGKGFIVIDADSKEAVDWITENLTYTPVGVSTAKGRHFYYQIEDGHDVKNSVGKNKIDIRGIGGYVVAAGSVHESGHVYQWLESCPYPSFLDMATITHSDLSKIESFNRGVKESGEIGNLGYDTTAYAPKSEIDFEPPKTGGRNNGFAQQAGSLLRYGLDLDAVKNLLRGQNSLLDDPLSEVELFTTIESVFRTHIGNNPEWRPTVIDKPINHQRRMRRGCCGWTEPYEWLIDGFLPDKSVGFLSGPSANGKTFVAVELCFSVMTGRPFLGHYDISKYPGAAAYFTVEGKQGMDKRFESYSQKHNIGSRVTDKLLWQDGESFSFRNTSPDTIAEMLKRESEETNEELRLVVFDTFRAYGGLVEENASGDVELALSWMRRLRDLTGAVVCCIHHSGKKTDSIKIDCDADHILRGSSNLKGGAEFVIGVLMGEAESESGFPLFDVPFVWSAKLKDAKKQPAIPAPILTHKLFLPSGVVEEHGVIDVHAGVKKATPKTRPKQMSKGQVIIWQSIRSRLAAGESTAVQLIRDDFKHQQENDGVSRPGNNFGRTLNKALDDGFIEQRDGKLFPVSK